MVLQAGFGLSLTLCAQALALLSHRGSCVGLLGVLFATSLAIATLRPETRAASKYKDGAGF